MVTQEQLVAKRDEMKQNLEGFVQTYNKMQAQAQELNQKMASFIEQIKVMNGQVQMLDSLIGDSVPAKKPMVPEPVQEQTVTTRDHPIAPKAPEPEPEQGDEVVHAEAELAPVQNPASAKPGYDASSVADFLAQEEEGERAPEPPETPAPTPGMRGSTLEVSQE